MEVFTWTGHWQHAPNFSIIFLPSDIIKNPSTNPFKHPTKKTHNVYIYIYNSNIYNICNVYRYIYIYIHESQADQTPSRKTTSSGYYSSQPNHRSYVQQETPELVKVLKTHNRLVCIDGRFPHWVSGDLVLELTASGEI